jgi:4-alpha-glucanotransferase
VNVETNPRRSGLLIPLFSIPSSRSWGIGEIGDIERVTKWLAGAGQRVLQLLPITETASQDPSPYGAISAMAIDPQYITVDVMEDFVASGGEERLDPECRATLDLARSATAIDYRRVRDVKQVALRRAFAHFLRTEWARDSTRAAALRAFIAEEAWWLDDYALFRALHARYDERAWSDWPEAVRTRQPHALEVERLALGDEILYRQYLQWTAGEQWAAARVHANGVALFGDLPFMVSGDSADVWARQDEFVLDGSVGVPPDAFSATGQDWGLPAYCWDVVQARDFSWLRARAKRMSALFDGCRVDHLVGFYRTFIRPRGGGEGAFTPAEEDEQRALGERVLDVLRSEPIEIVAEDLGTVPDFVRESLARLAVPGYKVFRWERLWQEPGQPFRPPQDYPAVSVATSGTHDTEPMTVWWATAPIEERQAVLALPSVWNQLTEGDRAQALEAEALSPPLRESLLEALFASGANLLILPIQDVFGWSDRINQPATVGDQNWTWRLPWPSDRMSVEPEAVAVGHQLREWSRRYER